MLKRTMSSVASSASIGRFINVIGIDASTTNQLTSILQTEIADKDEQNNIEIVTTVSEEKTPSMFSTYSYTANLSTKTMGRNLLYSPLLNSTQTVMQHISNKIPHGSVCVADQQTAGRGRGSNVWYSPPGCLLFSFTFATKDGTKLPFAQYLMSLALVKAIHRLPECSDMPIKIKWPNDIYANINTTTERDEEEEEEKNETETSTPPSTSTVNFSSFTPPPKHGSYSKIGGVLCQSSYDYESKSFVVVAGIGLNVNNHAPTTCLQSLYTTNEAGNDSTTVHEIINRENVLSHFFNELEPMLETFNRSGFETFYDNYVNEWLHTGQKVMVCDLNERRKQGESFVPNGDEGGEGDRTEVTIIGVAESSGLLAIDDKGQRFELLPDGNSLDFLQGLIKRKIPI
jgi:biotin---protein ligase